MSAINQGGGEMQDRSEGENPNGGEIRIKAEIIDDIIEENSDDNVIEHIIKQEEGKEGTSQAQPELKPEETVKNFVMSNPLKRKRVRSRNRRKRSRPSSLSMMKNQHSMSPTSTQADPELEYCLIISNLPKSWSFMDIKNYIDTECGPVDEMELIKDENTENGAVRMSYETEEQCRNALDKLRGKEIDGNKLFLEMTIVQLDSDDDWSDTTEVHNKETWKPDLDDWEIDPKGLYGLQIEYLKSLDITPPIDKWVHVSNLSCDKTELRDVMELAGRVLLCSVFAGARRYAHVMYSHPLEAVQAVSMLNGQTFYGRTLRVVMDRGPANTVLLPKGLLDIGPGLGVNGKPLRHVTAHYRRLVEGAPCLLDPRRFHVRGPHPPPDVHFRVQSVVDFCPSPPPTAPAPQPPPPPRPAHAHVGARPFVPPARVPGPAPYVPPRGGSIPPPAHRAPAVLPPGSLGWGPPAPPPPSPVMPRGPPHLRPPNVPLPVQLQLSNLPPSTTFFSLSEKMSVCGQVLSLQLTTPGCAVVRYATRGHAEMCMQTYNGKFLDGYMVRVAYS